LRRGGNFYANLEIPSFGEAVNLHNQRGIWGDLAAQNGSGWERFERFALGETILFPL
jgi:hypothetical protein